MINTFVREGYLYSREELIEVLEFDVNKREDINSFCELERFLKTKKLLKTRKRKGSRESEDDDASLISEEDIDYEDYIGEEGKGTQYLFRFVGLIFYKDRVINVFPKYIESDKKPCRQMEQVIKVIKKHQGKQYKLDVPELLEEAASGDELNMLSIILFLMNDYSSNDLYAEDQTLIEINGNGDVLWQKTVDEIDPIIVENRPFYYEMYTTRRVDNESNYFVRLHKWALTECSNECDKVGLNNYFNLPQLYLSEEDEETLGGYEHIMNSLESEMSQQFDDRKLAVLHALYLFLVKKNKGRADDVRFMREGSYRINFFGTRAFHNVWEDVIDEVYISQKTLSFKDIKSEYVHTLDYTIVLPNGSTGVITGEHKLGEIIEKPEWWIKNSHVPSTYDRYLPGATFIPDYLKISESNEEFYILDAKYYMPKLFMTAAGERRIERQPGVEDVVKQYMYYIVYRRLLKNNGIAIKHVKNYYVMPTEKETEDVGYAKLDVLKNLLSKAEMENLDDVFDIRIKKLNAEKLFDYYLSGEHLDVASIV